MLTQENLDKLGEVISARMAARGYDNTDLANQTGISRQYIGQIVKGFRTDKKGFKRPKDIGTWIFVTIAKALEMPVNELFEAAGYEVNKLNAQYSVQSQVTQSEQFYIMYINKRAVSLPDYYKLERNAMLFVKGAQFEQAELAAERLSRAQSQRSDNAVKTEELNFEVDEHVQQIIEKVQGKFFNPAQPSVNPVS